MSTDRDRLFLAASNPSTSASTSSALYGSHNHSATIPVTTLDNSLLSNGTSSATNGAQVATDKSVGPARAKQQIIIHEFLNSNSAPFIDHHHHHPHLPAGSNGQPLASAVNNSSITILTTATAPHSQNGSSPPRLSDTTVPKRSTMVLDRINICINNHFNEPQSLPALNGTPEQLKPTTMVTSEKRASTDLEPDSTTSSLGQLQVTPEKASNGGGGSGHAVTTPGGGGAKFKLQEDVLVEHKDGRFYLGTVIAIGTGQCLVRFNDNTECWSDFRELTKLSSGNEVDDGPACVLCKRHNADDSVEVCENCGRGYHVKCMDGNFERNGYWFCRMCTSPNGKRKDIRYVCSGVLSESLDPLNAKSQLPYDIDSLTWDGLHRTNLERQYCYCGTDGDWLQEMIQCCRCQQWFHGRCIRSLQYPIFLGDRFYFFICSICNHGHEFVRRLEVSWPDLIHLALYNLIVRTGKRFFDVQKAIAAYVEENWKTLQMSEQMTKISPNARKEIITQTLTNDQKRFRCGSEAKKAATMWTLRFVQPPSPQPMLIQPGEIITEHLLTQIAKEVRIYRFLPRVALEKSFVNDGPSRERMAGASYCSPLVSEEDVASEVTSEDTNQDENSSDYEALTGAGTGGEPPYCGTDALVPSSDQSSRPTKNSVAIFANTGKTASSNLSDSLFSSNAKDGFQLFGTNQNQHHHHNLQSGASKDNRRAFKSRLPKKTDSEKSFDIYDSSDDTSRNTLDLIIPPPKDFTGKNNPFHQPTTTTASNGSVAAVGTTATTTIPGGSVAFNGTPVTAVAYHNNETKDLIQKAASSSTSNGSSHLSSNLQVNGEMRVARIVKRRLSARDIMAGTKYKRRKFRKSSVIGTTITAIPAPSTSIPLISSAPSSSLIASLFSQPLPDNGGGVHLLASTSSSGSSTPASCSLVAPQPLPAISSGSGAAAVAADGTQYPSKRSPAHGRRLRQRQERNYAESTRRASIVAPAVPTVHPATPQSPLKSELVDYGAGESSAAGTDLQSSLNQYFGATHRILSGEKFVVRGKRISLAGKVQYLIEWEGCPAPVM